MTKRVNTTGAADNAEMPVRHGGKAKRKIKNHVMGITKPAIRRMARRGGVKRISSDVYNYVRNIVIVPFIKAVARDAITICSVYKRKTLTVMDILDALKRQNMVLYGLSNMRGD